MSGIEEDIEGPEGEREEVKWRRGDAWVAGGIRRSREQKIEDRR